MKRNQTLRRGLGILLSLVMCLSLLPATALAADDPTDITEKGVEIDYSAVTETTVYQAGTGTVTYIPRTTTNDPARLILDSATVKGAITIKEPSFYEGLRVLVYGDTAIFKISNLGVNKYSTLNVASKATLTLLNIDTQHGWLNSFRDRINDGTVTFQVPADTAADQIPALVYDLNFTGKGVVVVTDADGDVIGTYTNKGVPTSDAVKIDSNSIRDYNFLTYLKQYDEDGDGYFSNAERQWVTEIDISKSSSPYIPNIHDLAGIELFENLTKLVWPDGKLTALDVSRNDKLTHLDCHGNQLKTLDVSKNGALTYLDCRNNQLETLNVSKNDNLTYLDCRNNQLKTLDVSQNGALKELHCGINNLTELTLNTGLTYLDCGYNNNLNSLDVGALEKLECLGCPDTNLSALDLKYNQALTLLNCSNNQLKTLDVSKNSALKEMSCAGNQLAELDVSQNSALTYLVCRNNQLTKLTLNAGLETLGCDGNRLETLDISGNNQLKSLTCSLNKLKELDIQGKSNLEILDCRANNLTYLDCTGTKLSSSRLSAKGNFFVMGLNDSREFKLSKLPEGFNASNVKTWTGATPNEAQKTLTLDNGVDEVSYVYDCGNGLTVEFYLFASGADNEVAINEENFPDVQFRQFVKQYDIDGNETFSMGERLAVSEIRCAEQNIKSLKGIESFPLLLTLVCSGNQLETLDVSKNTKLEVLDCTFNQLKTLDVSGNLQLKQLSCDNNQLTSLDLSKNTALKELSADGNRYFIPWNDSETRTVDLSTLPKGFDAEKVVKTNY